MNLNKAQLAREIESYAKLTAKISELELQRERHGLVIKKAKGGESKNWIAKIVPMPEKTVVVKAHKQLRLYERKEEPVARKVKKTTRVRSRGTGMRPGRASPTSRWPFPE